jgi:hypothetical protein
LGGASLENHLSVAQVLRVVDSHGDVFYPYDHETDLVAYFLALNYGNYCIAQKFPQPAQQPIAEM